MLKKYHYILVMCAFTGAHTGFAAQPEGKPQPSKIKNFTHTATKWLSNLKQLLCPSRKKISEKAIDLPQEEVLPHNVANLPQEEVLPHNVANLPQEEAPRENQFVIAVRDTFPSREAEVLNRGPFVPFHVNTVVELDTFFRSVRTLCLPHNLITSIEAWSSLPFDSVRILDLSKNKITTLKPLKKMGLPNLTELAVEGNPLNSVDSLDPLARLKQDEQKKLELTVSQYENVRSLAKPIFGPRRQQNIHQSVTILCTNIAAQRILDQARRSTIFDGLGLRPEEQRRNYPRNMFFRNPEGMQDRRE